MNQETEVAAEPVLIEGLASVIGFYAMMFILLGVPLLMVLGRARRDAPKPDSALSPAPEASAFTSDRERRLWLYVGAVLLAIYCTLSPAQELSVALRERGLLGISSAVGMALVALVIAVPWAKTRPGVIEVAAGLGVAAAYILTIVRLPVPEARSHLVEYGLVAILIDQALMERRRNGRHVPVPSLVALVATAILGWVDEGIQGLLPNRVYDLVDVGQNAGFALLAVASSLFMRGARAVGERLRDKLRASA